MNTSADDAQLGRLHTLLSRFATVADDWAHREGERGTNALLVATWILLLVLTLAGAAGVALALHGDAPTWILVLLLMLLGSSAVIVIYVMHQVHHHLLTPLSHLYNWALRMCDGDLSARIALTKGRQFGKLTFHINRLSEALERLANQMDEMVWSQTERLQQKNQSLEMLYAIAAAVNTSDALDDLLAQAAERLLEPMRASTVAVYLRDENRCLQLARTVGKVLSPPAEPMLGKDSPADDKKGSRSSGDASGTDLPELVTVPLVHQNEHLGVLVFYRDRHQSAPDSETDKLLDSVGKHLGMAIAQSALDRESRNLSLMRERTALAHELHDSLAQTIAGVRLQVKMLAETLEPLKATAAQRELERIKNSLDEAHHEARELIANFQAPVDERGLLSALEDTVARFRRKYGMEVYFQTDCQNLSLPAATQMQVLRIVGEALANAHRHSRAHTVRLLLRRDDDVYTILVEDDGVGFDSPVLEGRRGEHIGLSIMQERAQRIGGELRIESEPGEGTRVSLTLAKPTAQ